MVAPLDGYLSINEFTSDGSKTEYDLSFAGGYLSRDDISLVVYNESGDAVLGYTFTWLADYQVSLSAPPPLGYTVRFERNSPYTAPVHNFSDGALITETNLDQNANQAIFLAAELRDRFGSNADVADLAAMLTQAQTSEAAAIAAAAQAAISAADAAATIGPRIPMYNTFTELTTGTVTVPSNANTIATASYAAGTVRGGARYVFVPAPMSLPSQGQNKWWFTDGAGRRFTLAEQFPTIDHFGAIGDGASATADTAAIDAAWLFSRLGAQFAPSGGGGNGVINSSVVMRFSGGSFIYSGTGLVNNVGTYLYTAPVVMLGAGHDATRVKITTAITFCMMGAARSAYVADIEFLGGNSVFYWDTQASLVTNSKVIFERLIFSGYLKYAIGSDRTDHPGLQISRCSFSGEPETGTASAGGVGATFGVAWGAFCDEVTINDNVFGANAYDIKLGCNLSGSGGNFRITRNGFFGGSHAAGTSSNRKSNIWIVSRQTGFGDGAGTGGLIADNKFGNEGRTLGEPATPRILFASEDQTSTTLPTICQHSTTNIDGYIHGIIIRGNSFYGQSGESVGVIWSETRNIAFDYLPDNIRHGAVSPYILYWGAAVQAAGLFASNTAYKVNISVPYLYGEQINGTATKLSNMPTTGSMTDFRGDFLGEPKIVQGGSSGAGYKLLKAIHGSATSGGSGVTSTTVADQTGALLARRLVFGNGTANTGVGSITGYDHTRPLIIEIDLRASPTNGVSTVQIGVDRFNSYATGNWSRVELTTAWRTIRRIVDFRGVTGDTLNIGIQAVSGTISTGVTDAIEIGVLRVYQCEAYHTGEIIGAFDPGDVNATATAGVTPKAIITTTPLTAARTLTLDVANRLAGDEHIVSRVDTGGFALTVTNSAGAYTIASLAAGQWARFLFNGTAWVRIASGTV